MTEAIFGDGKEYISAIRAAEKCGYSSDYIGQLCRAKRIPAKLIGKAWYVDLKALEEHKKNRSVDRGYQHTKTPEIKVISVSRKFIYEREKMPLLPTLNKKEKPLKSTISPKFVLESAFISLLLIMAIPLGILLGVEPAKLALEELNPPSLASLDVSNLSLMGTAAESATTLLELYTKIR